MDEPIKLADRRLTPCSDVVELLRSTLARAESGEIRGVVISAACDANCDATAYALGDRGIAPLVLSLRRAELRLLELE